MEVIERVYKRNLHGVLAFSAQHLPYISKIKIQNCWTGPLLKQAYDWIRERLPSFTPQPVPEPIPVKYMTINGIV